MADFVNLRQVRKRKQRSEKEAAAAANRLRHGRFADEKKETASLRALAEERLEGHRRGPSEEGGGER